MRGARCFIQHIHIYIYLLSLYTVFDNNKHVVACCSIKVENLTNTSDK